VTRDHTADFLRDIARHEMQILHDDGVKRHIRFKRPGEMCMHFDLITWPGCLCYTGDMGTYVFRRLHDMFQFFRRTERAEPYRIDMRYWAEKVDAADRDGVQEFSEERFKADVRDYFDQVTADDEDWPEDRKAALWQEISEQVLGAADDGEHWAWVALHGFEHDGFSFIDWDRSCKRFTHRFVWCCHALQWAIGVYDAAQAKQASEVATNAQA
jgi:hypothetical protein